MESRESQQHHHHHQQWPPGMMMAPPPNSYNQNILNNTNTNNGNTNPMITPNSAENQLVAYNQLPMNSQYSDGSSAGGGPAGGAAFTVEPTRKKRGRPRKYSPDGNIAAGAPSPVAAASISTPTGQGDSAGGAGSEPSAKRSRGRPPGSGKKQLDALGAPGVGFTPHVITVKSGEDVSARVMAFSQQGPRTVCILSANGAISNVTLRQPAMSGGTVTVEGRFEIISLSGSYSPAESNNGSNCSRPGGLSVSLAGSDGRVLGGGVAGMLIAATPVQVVVGSFIADGKKPKSGGPPTSSTPPPASASASVAPPPPNMLNFGGGPPTQGISPPSEGASSESSDDSDSSPFNQGPEPFDDPNPPIHNNYPPIYGSDWQSNNMNMYRN